MFNVYALYSLFRLFCLCVFKFIYFSRLLFFFGTFICQLMFNDAHRNPIYHTQIVHEYYTSVQAVLLCSVQKRGEPREEDEKKKNAQKFRERKRERETKLIVNHFIYLVSWSQINIKYMYCIVELNKSICRLISTVILTIDSSK